MTEYEYSPEAHQAFTNKMSSVSKWRHNMSHYDLVSPEQPYTPELARAKLIDIDNYERERGRGRPRLDEAEELERLRPKTAPPPQAPPPQQQVFAAYPGQYWNYPPQPTVAVKQPHRKHASYAIASSSTQNLPQIHRPTPTYAYPHPAAPPPPLPQFPQNHNHKHPHPRHVSLAAARANTYPQTIPQQKMTQVTVGHPPNPTPPPHGKGFIPPAYYTSGNGNPFLGGAAVPPGKKPFFKRMFSIFGPTRPQTSMGFHPPPQIPVGVAPLPEPRRSSRDHRRSKSSHRREEGVYRRDRRDSF